MFRIFRLQRCRRLVLVVIYFYTIWLTHIPLLCLVAPGLDFGTLMVMGSHFALSGSYSLASFVASLVPFFLVSNQFLLNQFPDVEADQSIGRKHFPIIAGRKASSYIYTAFMAGAYLTILLGVIFKALPLWSLLGSLTLDQGLLPEQILFVQVTEVTVQNISIGSQVSDLTIFYRFAYTSVTVLYKPALLKLGAGIAGWPGLI